MNREIFMKLLKLAAIAVCSLWLCVTVVQAGEQPRTLFDIAGVKPEAGKLTNSVLVIIDAQREYTDGALPLTGVNEAITEIGKLLARARQSDTPVIHVVHKGKGALFNPAASGFEIVSALHPQNGEAIVEKMRVSSFAETKLEEYIQYTGRKNLIIVGFMTHNCVSSTVRVAMDKGYMPTVVAAATATRGLPNGKGGFISASLLQSASLAALADRNAVVVQTEREIQE